jgi:hypothetical protein
MTVEHRDLTSADVHEPKGISDTTASDAGKVITPSSSGDSEIRYLTPEEVGMNFAYGEVDVDNSSTAFAVPAAVDGTFNTATDFVPINNARAPSTAGELFNTTFDGTANTLTTTIAGTYRLTGWANVKSSAGTNRMAFRYTISGVADDGKLETDIKDAGRTQNISGSSLVSLPAGSVIGFAVASENAANVTIADMRLGIHLLRET